jgi:hypothetical protein
LQNHPYIQSQSPLFLLEDPLGVDVDLPDFWKIA